MSRELVVEVEPAPIERTRAELVVVPLFEDERPLQGGAGRLDWRLCGRLSALVASGRLAGARGDAALLACFGGLRAPRLLVLGAGPRAGFDLAALEALARDALERAVALRLTSLALPLGEDHAARAGSLVGPAAEVLRAADDGAALRLILVVGKEEVLRTTDLLQRGGVRGVVGDVSVRLPPLGGPPRAKSRAALPDAPRGPQFVK